MTRPECEALIEYVRAEAAYHANANDPAWAGTLRQVRDEAKARLEALVKDGT